MDLEKPIIGQLAVRIRQLAREGTSPRRIANRYGVDPAAVRAFLATTPKADRYAKGTARQITAQTARRVRTMIDKGWNDADIAAALELDPQRVRDFMWRLEPVRRGRLTRPRTRAEQERLEQNQNKLPALPKPKRPPDAWKAAALEDPRYLDPVATLDPPELLELPELVDQAAAELAPPPAAAAITEPWGSPQASGPRKITADVLAAAVKLHQEGESWPAIAKRFGVHRMAFYHALRREA